MIAMPRNVTVTFDDGTQHVYNGVPDKATPEQVTARAQQDFGRGVTALDGGRKNTTMQELGAVADTGLRGGVLGAPVGAAQFEANPATSAVARGLPGGGLVAGLNAIAQHFTGKDAGQAVLDVTGGDIRKPQTEVGKTAGNVLAGATSAVVGGPGALVPKLIQGAAGGLGTDIGGRLTNGSVAGQIVGGMIGGGVPALATKLVPSSGNIAKEILSDAKLQDLEEAVRRMQQAEAQGTSLNASQAMRTPSNIDAAMSTVANSKYGEGAREQLRRQVTDAEMGAEQQLGSLPGRVGDPHAIATRAQEGATNAIKALRNAAGAAWAKVAPEGAQFQPQTLGNLDAQLQSLAAKYPNRPQVQNLIEDVRDALVHPVQQQPDKVSQILGANGLPVGGQQAAAGPTYLTDALQLKGAVTDALAGQGKRMLNTSNKDAASQQVAQQIRGMFKDAVAKDAPDLAKANLAYETVMNESVNPAKQSVIGQVAGITGYNQTREAAVGKLFNVLDEGTPAGAKVSRILTLEKALRKEDPTIFQDAAKTWVAKKLDAIQNTATDRAPEGIASQLVDAFGDPRRATQQWQTTKDILAGVARSQGVPEDQVVKGFQNFMTTIASQSRRAGSTSTAVDALANPTAGGVLRTAGNFNVFNPLRQPALATARALDAGTLKKFDAMLTSSEGLQQLMRLAKEQPNSPLAQAFVQTAIGTAGAVNASR